MNDLQIGPKSYPKEYDPYTLKRGDILQYLSGGNPGVLYEFVEPRDHHDGPNYFSMDIQEYCNPRSFNLDIDSDSPFSYGEDYRILPKKFSIKLRFEDKVLKSNMCKVLAARFLIADELNNMLIELDI